jgi:predicted phosphodiesterase
MTVERTTVQAVKRSGHHPAPKLRTLVLSDLHLGRATTRAHAPEIIAPLLEGFDRVLLLGDIIDQWYTPDQQAKALEQRIRVMCKSAGVKELIYFRGNHDACLGGEEFALLDGILYLHGHALYHRLRGNGSAKSRIQALNRRKFGERRAGSRSGRHIWNVIDHVYGSIPMAMLNPIAWPWPVVWRIRSLVDEIAPDGGVRGVVLGHTHRPGVRRLGDVTLFNLGGWLKNTRAFAFIREGDRTKLVHVENHTRKLCFGEVLHEQQLKA